MANNFVDANFYYETAEKTTIVDIRNERGPFPTIPSTVTRIGGGAFSNYSGLTGTITIPSSVTSIGRGAFNRCSGLTGTLTIPSSVTSIGEEAFGGCEGFTSLIFANNTNLTSIGKDTFRECTGLTGILTIPSSVTSIGEDAFKECDKLTSLTIPSSVTSIGNGAFAYCSGLTGTLTIPSSVKTIDNNAFLRCYDLTSLIFENNSSLTTIGYNAFSECTSLTGTLTIPSSVTIIGAGAFSSCEKLTSLIFANNSKLTNISDVAFGGCTGLTGTLRIPSSVKTIGEYAFADCSKLSKIYYFATTTIGTDAFMGSVTPTLIGIFAGLIIENDEVIGFNISKKDKVTLKFPTIPSTVISIGAEVFKDRNDLIGTLTIPSSVRSIGQEAFSGCTKLSKISYFTGTTIGTDAFKGCVIPTVLPWFVIDYDEFIITGFKPDKRDKVSLSIPTIPSTVYSIGPEAFKDRNDLTGNLVIPSNIGIIHDSAFSGCTKLSKISYFATTTIGTDAFKGCKPPTVLPWFVFSDTEITSFVPDKREKVSLKLPPIPFYTTAIYGEAFKDRNDLTGTLIIPSSVTEIGIRAFENCTGLTGNLVIPSSVESIGISAFSGCTKLSKISYFGSTQIFPDAFKGCKPPTVLPAFVIDDDNVITGILPYSENDVTLKFPTIPSTVTGISDEAFVNRDDLTGTVEIPSSVTSIGNYAFFDCRNLTKISYFASTIIGEEAFINSGAIPTVLPWFVIDNNEITEFLPAKKDKVSLKLPKIPSSVRSITNNAFKDRNDITGTLAIPSSVTEIGISAFENCTGLTGTLAIPSSVTSIGSSAFSGCTKLSKISYFATTTIGTDAFKGCKKPTIIIPKKMIKINSFKIGFYRGKLII